mgnify:CR=1 FL=1
MTKQLSRWIENNQILDDMDNWWGSFNMHIEEHWNITDWKTLYRENENQVTYGDEKDLQHYVSDIESYTICQPQN